MNFVIAEDGDTLMGADDDADGRGENPLSQGDSIRLIINPQGDGGEGAHWVAPTPGIRNDITDISVGENIMLFWEQYDKAHSLILSLLIHDNFGEDRFALEQNRGLTYE